jgi:hypothetical protein
MGCEHDPYTREIPLSLCGALRAALPGLCAGLVDLPVVAGLLVLHTALVLLRAVLVVLHAV